MKESIRVRHSIPGRVRFLVSVLRHADSLASHLEAETGAWPGVIWVRANARGGSLVVGYDPETTSEPRIIESLSALLNGGAGEPVKGLPFCASPLCECSACAGS
jgi:cation-transporting P-type ATPase C